MVKNIKDVKKDVESASPKRTTRKDVRRAANEQRRRTNLASKSEASSLGQTYLTPNETARAARAERRAPLRQAFKLHGAGKSTAEWEACRARAEALAAGEAIRREQRNRGVA